MKVYPVSDIARIDKYTIEKEPIASVDLMERASQSFCEKFKSIISAQQLGRCTIEVYAGPGNNGGDALAIARLLAGYSEMVNVWIVVDREKLSADGKINLQRLEGIENVSYTFIAEAKDLDYPPEESVIIDGLFGSGLNRPLTGFMKEVVTFINAFPNRVVAIDIPSGLMGEDNASNDPEAIVKACWTITFQMPKLAFLLADNEAYVGEWYVVDIGLHPAALKQYPARMYYTESDDIIPLIRERKRFEHKGHYGHALLLAGSYGKMGAAVLAARACLKAGVGLLTTHVPRLGCDIIQTAVPESMASIDRSDILISEHPALDSYSAVGIGPGIGTKPNTVTALVELLHELNGKSVVVDADGINILSKDPKYVALLPPNTVLTPHPGEFDRLAGPSSNAYERLMKAITYARTNKVVLVLKGAYTAVVAPTGECFFNSSGNAGMATAGSGDVLTGVILSLLAQGYDPLRAARTGVFLHGMAADEFVSTGSMQALVACDIVENINRAYRKLNKV